MAVAVMGLILSACGLPRSASVTPQEYPELLILESSSAPVYTRVTAELLRLWPGQTRIETLDAANTAVNTRVRRSRAPLIAAIGLPAALVARSLPNKRVVFCQVFNYREYKLIGATMKGVDALPPVQQHFDAWHAVSPQLKRVAMVTGPGLDSLLASARRAAARNQMSVSHWAVQSDLEALYAFKRLGPDIQGLWLVPDNRILSAKLLRDVLTLADRQGIQVLVSNPQLLRLGAWLSAESDPADIAQQVASRLRAAATHGAQIPGPAMVPLTKVKVQIATRTATAGGTVHAARELPNAN